MTSGPENIEQLSPEQTPSSEAAPSPLVAALQREHPEWVREVIVAFGETTIVVPRENIVESRPVTLPVTFTGDVLGVVTVIRSSSSSFTAILIGALSRSIVPYVIDFTV